jgi:hypothetical protein
MVKNVHFFIILIFCCFCLCFFNSSVFAQTTTDTPVQYVKIQNGQLWVISDDGLYKPFFIKGVDYQPIPIGRHPSDWGWPYDDSRSSNIYDDPGILNRDFAKIQQMNANTIRFWKGNDTQEYNRFPNKLTIRAMLLAAQYHLKIIAGFWVNDLTFDSQGNVEGRQDIITRFVEYVYDFKKYSAILCWAIGNENNYNKINGRPMSLKQLRSWYVLVNEMAHAAHDAEGASFHPVAVVNGEIANIGDASLGTTDEQMPDLNIWGVNAYRGRSFYTLFTDYQKKSKKPLWISEFGIDAWHANDIKHPEKGYEDQDTQSEWDGSLWDEIVQNAPTTIGGTVMEYSDEWWKPSEWYCTSPYTGQDENAKRVAKCISNQNHFGHMDAGFPDGFSSEQWYGVMSIARNPSDPKGPDQMTERKVYFNLQKKWQSNP